MEELLRLEADAKSLLGMTDRSYEQKLMNELLKIMEVAEWLFGPAKILCADFESSWLVGSTWGEHAVGGAKIFAKGVRSYWDLWKSV